MNPNSSLSARNAPPARRPDRTGKLDAVVADCIYQIATGAWQPGRRMPPLRAAKDLWGVNEVTCFRAYRRLVEDGLVESRDRDGYFVAGGAPVVQLGRNQADFRGLFEWFRSTVHSKARLSVLGAARAIAQMAESAAAESPECAFVECTRFQSEDHAAEVRRRLRVPCAALTTDDVRGGRIPAGVRALITTPFHIRDLARVKSAGEITVAVAPIELAGELVESLKRSSHPEIVSLALKAPLAKNVASDIAARVGSSNKRFTSRGVNVGRLDSVLTKLLGPRAGGRGRNVVLSPSLWSSADEKWRGRVDVRPLRYRIVETAWPTIGDALGLPLAVNSTAGDNWAVARHG